MKVKKKVLVPVIVAVVLGVGIGSTYYLTSLPSKQPEQWEVIHSILEEDIPLVADVDYVRYYNNSSIGVGETVRITYESNWSIHLDLWWETACQSWHHSGAKDEEVPAFTHPAWGRGTQDVVRFEQGDCSGAVESGMSLKVFWSCHGSGCESYESISYNLTIEVLKS